MKISANQMVTWNGSFGDHPLHQGIASGTPTGDQAGNPIPSVTTGTP